MKQCARNIWIPSRVRRRGVGLTVLAFVTAACAPSTDVAAEDEAQPADIGAAYQAMIEHSLAGGGYWIEPNDKYEPSGAEPKYWLKHYSRGPGDYVLIIDSFAVAEDNTCTHLLHAMAGWNGADDKVKSVGMTAGPMFEGAFAFPRPGEVTHVLKGVLPNGALLELKDVSDISEPGVQKTVGARKQDGEWIESDAVIWRLTTDAEAVCGS